MLAGSLGIEVLISFGKPHTGFIAERADPCRSPHFDQFRVILVAPDRRVALKEGQQLLLLHFFFGQCDQKSAAASGTCQRIDVLCEFGGHCDVGSDCGHTMAHSQWAFLKYTAALSFSGWVPELLSAKYTG